MKFDFLGGVEIGEVHNQMCTMKRILCAMLKIGHKYELDEPQMQIGFT